MPPKLPKLVPWHSPAEFIQVHQWFYPPLAEDGTPDIRAQECALRRVKAWEARGKLPHAIDSTAAFVGAIVRDWTGTCSDQDLRLIYSMIFIRFVNGYVDAFQSAKAAKSIAYLAVEKVGMPIWFVELRHTATHDYLPSLTILRSAAHQALAWINNNYWLPQLVSVKMDENMPPEMMSAMSDDVRNMIESYRSEKERQIAETTLPQPKTEALALGRLVRDLIKRCRSGEDLLDALIPILLEPGMLVPNGKKMRATVRDLNLVNLGRMVDLCWMPLMNKLFLDLRGTSSGKDGEPLSFWVLLLEAMLDKLIGANDAAQAAALPTATAEQKSVAKTGSYLITILAWMKHLIKLHYQLSGSPRGGKSTGSTTGSPSSTPRLSIAAMAAQLVNENTSNQVPPMFDNDDIINLVEDCLQNILVHVSPLIRSVLNTVIECDAEVKEKIGPILKQIDQRIVSGNSSTASSPSIPSVATITLAATPSTIESTPTPVGGIWQEGPAVDVQQQQQEVGADIVSEEAPIEDVNMNESRSMAGCSIGDGRQVLKEENSGAPPPAETWTMYDEDTWRPCPIGCLPGGIIPDLSLPWELDSPPIARVLI